MKNRKREHFSALKKKIRMLKHPLHRFRRCKREAIYAYQRIRKGYCEKDVWAIDQWFLKIVPNMLQELKASTHGFPDIFVESENDADGSERYLVASPSKYLTEPESNNEGTEKWKKILDEMIFLFREANAETCTMKNLYEAEYRACSEEFRRKYGPFGEKLKTEKELADEKEKKFYYMHTIVDCPEYKDICNRYIEQEMKIDKYRDECKNKGLDMFKKWFWQLWD